MKKATPKPLVDELRKEMYALLNADKRADMYVIPYRVMDIIVEHINKEKTLAERQGELYMAKMALHWAQLHNITDVIDYASHVISSLEQTPDQPLARITLGKLQQSEHSIREDKSL